MSESYQVLAGFSALLDNVPERTTGAAAGVWDELVRLISGAVRSIVDQIISPIRTTVTNVYTSVTTGLTTKVNEIKSYVGGLIGSVTAYIRDKVGELSSAINGVANEVIQGVGGMIDGIADAIRDAIQRLIDKIDGVINAVRSIGDTIAARIREAIQSIGVWIRDAIGNLVDSIGSWLAGIVDAVGEYLSNLYNRIKDALTAVYNQAREWVEDVYNRIADWIEGTLNHLKSVYEGMKATIEDKIAQLIAWLDGVRQALHDWFWGVMSKLGEFLAREVLPRIGGAIDGAKALYDLGKILWGMIEKGDYQGAFNLIDEFARGLNIPAPVSALHAIVSALAYFWEIVHLQFVPMEVAAQKRANIALALDPISIDVAAQGVYRGVASLPDYYHNAALAGVSADRAKIALEANRALPTPGAIQEAYLRGEITEKEHDQVLSAYGYTDEQIKTFKALYWLIPPPTDLIRMAVREVFSPEIAEKFGQFEDYPQVFTNWAVKQGISENWAKAYWAAHWDLPSAEMGFDMLHRRIIDEDELKLLLRALDVMPYWRERLIQLSYNPITRVDLRRMYKMGVLNEDDIYNGYLDLGYSPENARRLTEFTKRYSAPEDQSEQDEFRALARGVYSQAYRKRLLNVDEYRQMLLTMGYAPDDVDLLIRIDDYTIAAGDKVFELQDYRKDLQKLVLTAYNRGILSPEDTVVILSDLGYTQAEASLELSLADYARGMRLKDTLLDKLHDQYVGYIIDNVGLHNILNTFGFNANEIDKLVEEWEIERSFRTNRPSPTDLKKFYSAGLLNLDEYLDELRGIGYHEKYIDFYRQLLTK